MFGVALVEWLGYSASAFIVLSLVMTDVIKLRIINTIGCVLFVIYSCILKTYPVLVSNFIIVLINLYQLYKLYRKSSD